MYCISAYVYDQNYIMIRPMKNRTNTSTIEVFTEVYLHLQQKGINQKLHVLDNECSKAIKNFVNSQKMAIQLVEPHNHQANAAKTAVKTAKCHFIASLATVSPDCPLQLWCNFLPQVELTLNLLLISRQNASISAWEDLNGPFDYNQTPIAPIGTPAVVYKDPSKHGT